MTNSCPISLFTLLFNIFFLFLITPLQKQLSADIVIVHGSFARYEKWYQPGGDFYESINTFALKAEHSVYSFSWSGIPTKNSIYLAAIDLSTLLLTHTKTNSLILIGHSHGGNVINRASHLIYHYFLDHKETTTIYPGSSIITTLPHPSTHFDLTQTTRKKLCFLTDPGSSLEPYIDHLFLLGTPVEPKELAPNMTSIDKVTHIYSYADFIQTVAGFYYRTYPTHDRIYNLLVTSCSPWHYTQPSHSELHSVCIAEEIIKPLLSQELSLTVTKILLKKIVKKEARDFLPKPQASHKKLSY